MDIGVTMEANAVIKEEPEMSKKAVASFFNTQMSYYPSRVGVWSNKVDKYSLEDYGDFKKVIKLSRFFYRHEPLIFSVISKMVDLAINDLVITPEPKLSKTEIQIFEAIKDDLIKFLRKATMEYLLTGLVVPEISLTKLTKKQLREKSIQRIDSLLYPTDMWLRNSADIEIKSPFLSSKESYFVVVPNEVVYFITNEGVYEDGTKDLELYKELLKSYPKFIEEIRAGKKKIFLDNPLIVKGVALQDSPYPMPFIYPALESLMHKRNLKRMDYSIAARVISAILHVKVGSDEYPLTKDQEDVLDELEQKFKWRQDMTIDDVERVFTLFTNHTVEINWVFPEIEALLSDKKYEPINKDILIALGFPRILITGETERSFTSDPQVATLSPINTLNAIRDQLMPIVKLVYNEVFDRNRVISYVPKVTFKPINLMSLQLFYEGIHQLYTEGNLSRQSMLEAYGYDFMTEMANRIEEQVYFENSGLQEFAPVPHSNEPGGGNKPPQNTGNQTDEVVDETIKSPDGNKRTIRKTTKKTSTNPPDGTDTED